MQVYQEYVLYIHAYVTTAKNILRVKAKHISTIIEIKNAITRKECYISHLTYASHNIVNFNLTYAVLNK